jgi:GR25 family glycosyltransferase involved in LPS biosynthesis
MTHKEQSSMDPVFIILLKRDPKRSEHVFHVLQKQLSQPVNIFSAIDGPALTAKEIIQYVHHQYIYYDRLTKLIGGQVGIALSIILLLEKMVDQKIPHMCVLEDDALLCEGFENRYQKTCADLPHDYDFLYLFKHPYYYPTDHALYKKPPPNFLHYINSHTPLRFGDPELRLPGKKRVEKALPVCGIVGFRVSLSGAKKILQSVKPIYFPIDDMIMHMVIKKTLNAYSIKKGIVGTAGAISAWDLSENKFKSNVWGTNNYTIVPPNN